MNSNFEFICIKKDSISYCLFNNDGLGTYRFGIGTFTLNIDKIKIVNNTSENFTSSILKNEGIDSTIQFSLFDFEGDPIKFANISFSKQDECKSKKIYAHSDKNGIIKLSYSDSKDWIGCYISIQIESVGFMTTQTILLETAKNYVITSKIPSQFPFTIDKNNFIIQIYNINHNMISIRTPKKKNKIFLSRTGLCLSCSFQFYKLNKVFED
jgi:hypothetical protein